MVKKKAQFAAVPLRAVGDGRLTDRDFRILATVASHDRMSLSRGAGQGAWASHKTMASEVGGDGADYARFSVSMKKLVDLGYLHRDRLEGDARKHTYRVIYTDEDRLPQRKPSERADTLPQRKRTLAGDSLPSDGEPAEIVCRGGQLSDGDLDESAAQYISRSEGRDAANAASYSAEAGEIDSAEAARFAARDDFLFESSLTDGANLARLERALKSGSPIPRVSWYACLRVAADRAEDVQAISHVHRLSEELAARMTQGEIDRSLELYEKVQEQAAQALAESDPKVIPFPASARRSGSEADAD